MREGEMKRPEVAVVRGRALNNGSVLDKNSWDCVRTLVTVKKNAQTQIS